MHQRTGRVALLLFGSGMCALIYQVAWLRELRLVFGASTAAAAAVLAIFMGGLGAGGLVLGRRADRHQNPLALYAGLELLIAVSAALSPFLVQGVRAAYIALGGLVVLGPAGATAVRLALSALVLGVPALLMGGTLPAAARAVETDQDAGRRHLALLYGANTLGAVTGAMGATFLLLAIFGARTTLWLACLVNLLVAVLARALAASTPKPLSQGTVGSPELRPPRLPSAVERVGGAEAAPSGYVLAAAAVVGFVFLLMELVWYRMLGPLLGGTTYTFGLILAVVLLGIGLGGLAYAPLFEGRSPGLRHFALTAGAEALFLAIPYALGDRIAVLAAQLRSLHSFGPAGDVLGWSVVAALVILPAALVSGIQFPLLIALLGKGGHQVGRQTGLAYAWNTGGAIAGSLAGGFGALPLLTAPGTWRAVVLLLAALGIAALALSLLAERRPARVAAPAGAIAAALLVLFAEGPTAAWRHSPIGGGRVDLFKATRNELREWLQARRAAICWDADGRESSVALSTQGGLNFLVNGKCDGHSVGDASTQVMLGLVGAILHPAPRRSLVVGLGTGSSAGWLGVVPTMERVDVVELEPAIEEVARRCAPVNQDVLSNPKVRLICGDAREVILTTPERYDLIASEPSNPYRAGIASLYTREFYQAVASRLAEGGIFSQWLQGYEVETHTIRTIYATLASVFPVVETWQTNSSDLLLVCALRPIRYPVPALRERVQAEPFRTALVRAWRVEGLEGFLSHYVAHPGLARLVAAREGTVLNTDDHTVVEYGFASTVGQRRVIYVEEIRAAARARGMGRPETAGGAVDWRRVDEQHLLVFGLQGVVPSVQIRGSADEKARLEAVRCFLKGDFAGVLAAWGSRTPLAPMETAMVAEALAEAGDARALPLIERLRRRQPVEADLVLARLRLRQGRADEAVTLLCRALTGLRKDPWPLQALAGRGLDLAMAMAEGKKAVAARLYPALAEPYSVLFLDDRRLRALLAVASQIDNARAAQALHRLEPHVPWQRDILTFRARCYRDTGDPLAPAAVRDLQTYLENQPVGFAESLE